MNLALYSFQVIIFCWIERENKSIQSNVLSRGHDPDFVWKVEMVDAILSNVIPPKMKLKRNIKICAFLN